jgi:hypothetical protein
MCVVFIPLIETTNLRFRIDDALCNAYVLLHDCVGELLLAVATEGGSPTSLYY